MHKSYELCYCCCFLGYFRSLTVCGKYLQFLTQELLGSDQWIESVNWTLILFYFILLTNQFKLWTNCSIHEWIIQSVRFVMCIRGSLKITHSKEKIVQWSVSWFQSPESKICLQRLVNSDWIRIFGWPFPLIPTTYSSSTWLDSRKPVILLKI